MSAIIAADNPAVFSIRWEGNHYRGEHITEPNSSTVLFDTVQVRDGIDLSNEHGKWRVSYTAPEEAVDPTQVLEAVAALTSAVRLAGHLNDLDREAASRRRELQIEALQRRIHDGGFE